MKRSGIDIVRDSNIQSWKRLSLRIIINFLPFFFLSNTYITLAESSSSNENFLPLSSRTNHFQRQSSNAPNVISLTTRQEFNTMNIHERKKLKESTLNRNIINVRGGGMNGPSLEKINKSSDKLIRSNLPSPSKLRHTVFPIYGKDVKKFLLIGCIKFFIIMALTLTRDMKDTMIVTQCGAEAITFLKIYGVLPAAAAFIALYTKLSSMLGKERLFYTTCIPFFVFFLFFDYVVYPCRGIIQPSLEVTKSILGDRSGANEVLSNILLNWTSGLYFVVAGKMSILVSDISKIM